MRLAARFAWGSLLLLWPLTASAAPTELPKPNQTWIRVTTDNFTMVGNAPARKTIALGSNLERLREVLESTSVHMTTQSPVPTRIYVFKNDASFRPYKIGSDGRPSALAGFFTASHDGNYVAMDASVGEDPSAVIYHEYVHYWLENNFPGIPLWLNEGLAEFYSTFRARENEAEIGREIDEHLHWLARNRQIPLDELFELSTDSPDYNEGSRQGTFYAQSWALTHYLLIGLGEKSERFGEFLGLITSGHTTAEAVQTAFGFDLNELQIRLLTYASRGSYGFLRYTFDRELAEGESQVEELEYREVLFLLGDLIAHTPPIRYQAARDHLDAALKLDENYASVYATLGFLSSMQEDLEEAERLFRRAVELDPQDTRALWLYGSSLIELFLRSHEGPTVPIGETTPPMLLTAREQFVRALELSPAHAPSLAGLGKTYAFDLNSEEGMRVLTEAYKAMPSRTDLLVDLIAVTANAGKAPDARNLLEKLLRPRGEAEWTDRAEQAVVYAEMKGAIRLFNSGQPEQALAILKRSGEQTRNPEMRQRITAQSESLMNLHAANTRVDRYNHAVTLSNRGLVDEAVAELVALLPEVTDPQLRALAESLLDKLRGARRLDELDGRYDQALELVRQGSLEDAARTLELLLAEMPDSSDANLRARAEELLGAIRRQLEASQ